MKRIEDYKPLIDKISPKCSCGQTLTGDTLESYDHTDGWDIEGSHAQQWLYLHCPKCGIVTALWKIGITRPDGELDERFTTRPDGFRCPHCKRITEYDEYNHTCQHCGAEWFAIPANTPPDALMQALTNIHKTGRTPIPAGVQRYEDDEFLMFIGMETIRKTPRPVGNGAHVHVPIDWLGHQVVVYPAAD